MPADVMQFTLRQLRDVYTQPRSLALLAIVSMVAGLAGPFGTYSEFSVGPRLAYWTAIAFATYAAGLGGTILISAVLRERVQPLLLRSAIAGAAAGPAVTLVVVAINLLAYGAGETVPVWQLLAYCSAISAGVAVTLSLLAPAATGGPDVPDADEGAASAGGGQPAAILDRLPPGKRGALLALSVSDHYVDVITERGTTLVLMRLGDAMRETEGVPGLRIHRSHWVAEAAVVRALRENGRVLLEISNGMRLPVSRSAMAAVRAAGLLR